ncbi:MAG: hypothetical protein HYU99_07550, partial [Deltaproteobacteria bacterium]|nr:hypothetical protein [Deltaproteobacteria bacterium]
GPYLENAYRVRSAADPIGPVGINDRRVLRGGDSWAGGYPRLFRSGRRYGDYPELRRNDFGFRSAWSQD